MNNLGDFLGEAFLARTGARVLGMFGKDLVELFGHDEGEIFEVIFEGFVGLVEQELIEVENGGFFSIEPDGITLGLAKFATGNFVDDERARVAVGFGVFETFD